MGPFFLSILIFCFFLTFHQRLLHVTLYLFWGNSGSPRTQSCRLLRTHTFTFLVSRSCLVGISGCRRWSRTFDTRNLLDSFGFALIWRYKVVRFGILWLYLGRNGLKIDWRRFTFVSFIDFWSCLRLLRRSLRLLFGRILILVAFNCGRLLAFFSYHFTFRRLHLSVSVV